MRLVKTLACATAFLMIVGMFAEAANAQRRGGMMRMGGGSMISLLNMEEVREELDVKEEAADKLKDLAEDVQEEMRAEVQDLMADFRDMDEDEQAEARKEMQKTIAKINADANEELGKLLSKKQIARLKQLFVQRQGTAALQNAEVQKSLDITDEQKEKMAKASTELREEMREAFMEMRESGGGDREAMQEMMTELREKSEKAVIGVLTDKQKKKFAELKGKEFKFPERQRRGRGR